MTPLPSQISLAPADPHSEDAIRLADAMRAEVLHRYHDVIEPSPTPTVNDPPGPRSIFLIARLAGAPVACAALRPMDDHDTAEVRRMYVTPAARRHGIARLLLAALEQAASAFGYKALRLETGVRQPEAIALYESSGFHRIPPYGCHIGDPLSMCFEKSLTPASP